MREGEAAICPISRSWLARHDLPRSKSMMMSHDETNLLHVGSSRAREPDADCSPRVAREEHALS